MPKKHLVVAYHENCIDGLTAAWTVQQKWGKDPNISITYVAYAHYNIDKAEEKILFALTPQAELYFVDVAPRRDFLDTLLSLDENGKQRVAGITILDHHKTAAEKLAKYQAPITALPRLNIQIDETRPSASLMVWQELLPEENAPPFLTMIDKMDRGDGLYSPEDFSAAALIDSKSLASLTEAFNVCTALSTLSFEEMAEKGVNILADQKIRLAKLSEKVMHADIEIAPNERPLRVPIVNADVQNFGRTISQYLNDLGQKAGTDIAFAWHVGDNGIVSMSIRTPGIPDASQVAEHLCKTMGITGGGHKNSAAVFFPSLQKFCEKIVLQPIEPPAPPPPILPRN